MKSNHKNHEKDFKIMAQELPEGFTLDQPTGLPPGFTLDEPKEKDNFFERFGDDLKFRFGEQVAEIINRRVADDQGFASTALQLTGKVGAGTIVDFIGEALISGGRGLSNITPDFIEDPLKENATKAGILLLNTDLGQKGLEAARKGIVEYQEFAQEHPVAAANIEAVTNIGLLVTPVKGKPKPATPSIVGKQGERTVRSGRRSAVANRRKFVEELVTPAQSKKVRIDQVSRTTEKGVFDMKVVELSPQQKASALEINRVLGVSARKTLQGNYNAIAETVTRKAGNLEKGLSRLGKRGEYQWQEFANELNHNVVAKLRQNPALVGDAGKSAERVIEQAFRISANEEKTLAGLLRTRRQLDKWVRQHKPKVFEDGVANNAMTSAVRETRRQINTFINARAKGVQVQRSLQSQSRLLRAMDDLAEKAADEAKSKIGHVIQKTVKLIPVRNELVAVASLMFGVGGLGAAAMFLPFIQKLLFGVGIAYGGKRAVMSPATRRGLGKLIVLVDKAAMKTTDPAVIQSLRADKAALVELLRETKGQVEDAD